MNAKGWIMAAATVAVAAGTYFTLNLLYPHKVADPGGLKLIPAEQIFEGTAQAVQEDAAVVQEEVARPLDEADKALSAPSAEIETDIETDSVDSVTGDAGDADPADENSSEAEPEAGAGAAEPAEPAVEATPAPTPAATATPASTPAPTQTARPARTPAPVRPVATPVQQLTQWWAPESDTRLSILYAGSAAYTRALVLMFNGDFDSAASVQQYLSVTDAAGKPVQGQWEVGTNNKRMLLFPVSRNGVYTVTVKADLADSSGRRLGTEQKGPVRVQ